MKPDMRIRIPGDGESAVPRGAGWDAPASSQESLAPAVESMCWSRCLNAPPTTTLLPTTFLPLTVFLIHLRTVEVIGECDSASIKSQSLTLFCCCFGGFMSSFRCKRSITVNIVAANTGCFEVESLSFSLSYTHTSCKPSGLARLPRQPNHT